MIYLKFLRYYYILRIYPGFPLAREWQCYMLIEKKVWSEYFQMILDGTKKYELRLADFEVEPGDMLWLREWDKDKKNYTGREIRKPVSYVLKTKDIKFWSEEEISKYGYQIIAFD
jgi:hypothetical protein